LGSASDRRVVLQDGGVGIPSSLGILVGNGALFQASLDLLRRPSVVATELGALTEDEVVEELACLQEAAEFQSFSTRPATEAARLSILQEFVDDLSRKGRSVEQAQPADVVVYLTRWGKARGNYVLDGKRHVAPSSMQQRVSHLKAMLERYPSCRGPWQLDGMGEFCSFCQVLIRALGIGTGGSALCD
jgi:hypothetical protein